MIIRPVLPSDAKELLAIYAPYVTDTTITFDTIGEFLVYRNSPIVSKISANLSHI